MDPDARIAAEDAKKAAAIDAKVKEEKQKTTPVNWNKDQDEVLVRLFGQEIEALGNTVDTATLKA